MSARRPRVAVLGTARAVPSRAPSDLTLGEIARQVALDAIADAGLTLGDIDGLSVYTEPAYPESADGRSTVTPQYLWRALGLDLFWGASNAKFTGSALIDAHNAVAGDACRFALVIRAVDSVAERSDRERYGRSSSPAAHATPYGAHLPFIDYALGARRYFESHGATREDLGRFVTRNRDHALQDPDSYWSRNDPVRLTLADYLDARMIADPLSLYDCDIPVRGCVAFVLGPAGAAGAASHGGAGIVGFSQHWASPHGRDVFVHAGGRKRPLVEGAAELVGFYRDHLWDRFGLRPEDISSANVYDGFSILTWLWLEALGFAAPGEGFRLAQDDRTGLDGELPLNTAGGHLGAGALAGAPHLFEAATQAMGRAGARQIPDRELVLAAIDRPDRGQVILFTPLEPSQ